jgi:hypothetical protein
LHVVVAQEMPARPLIPAIIRSLEAQPPCLQHGSSSSAYDPIISCKQAHTALYIIKKELAIIKLRKCAAPFIKSAIIKKEARP